jgi:hypothetical protein
VNKIIDYFLKIVLAFVFLLIVTPVGIVLRILGKDYLATIIPKDADTYWIVRYTASGQNSGKVTHP